MTRLFVFASLLSLLEPSLAAAQAAELTAREFELYLGWKDAQSDAKLQKLTDEQRLKKIAKAMACPPKELAAAVKRVEPVASSVVPEQQRSLRAALERTPLKGRVIDVEVNADQPLVVAGVKFRCGDERDTDKDAAQIAWATGQGSRLVRTLALWCVDGREQKLFSGTIDRTGFEKIEQTQIERFASSRYIKMFIGVKRGPHE